MHQYIQIAGTGTTVGRTTRVEIAVLQQPSQQLAVLGVPLNVARLHHVLRSLLAGIECLGARKQEILAGKIDVDTQKEVCTGFAGYLAAVLQRHKRIVGTRQNDLDARLVLAYESRYAVGELQCQVLLQHLVQAGTLVFAAMSGIEHPHQRAQLPGCACQRQEQRYEDDKTFHTAKLLKIRSPRCIGNRFLGRQKLLQAKFAAWWFPLSIFPGRRPCRFAHKNALRCDGSRSALRWPMQCTAMKDAARCVFQRRTTAKPRQGIIRGKTYGRGDGSRAPWAFSQKDVSDGKYRGKSCQNVLCTSGYANKNGAHKSQDNYPDTQD